MLLLFVKFDTVKNGGDMPKLVIASEELLGVGQVYHDLRDPLGVAYPEQIFLVTKESTQKEWMDFVTSFGEKRDWTDVFSSFSFYFYEVRTD